MSNEQKPGDPADKGVDQFVSHRAGYGDDKLARVIDWLRAHPTTTLASGEGALLLGEIDRLHAAELDGMDHYADARAEIDRLRDDLHTQANWADWAKGEMERMREAAKDSADHYADARAEIDRLRRILAALREPSDGVFEAAYGGESKPGFFWGYDDPIDCIRAAVAAAEQEVGRE